MSFGTGSFNYILRNDNPAYFQPIKLLYTQTPQRVAVPQFSIYAHQLPRVREARPDFNDNLYCWLYLLDTANREKKTITEAAQFRKRNYVGVSASRNSTYSL